MLSFEKGSFYVLHANDVTAHFKRALNISKIYPILRKNLLSTDQIALKIEEFKKLRRSEKNMNAGLTAVLTADLPGPTGQHQLG